MRYNWILRTIKKDVRSNIEKKKLVWITSVLWTSMKIYTLEHEYCNDCHIMENNRKCLYNIIDINSGLLFVYSGQWKKKSLLCEVIVGTLLVYSKWSYEIKIWLKLLTTLLYCITDVIGQMEILIFLQKFL